MTATGGASSACACVRCCKYQVCLSGMCTVIKSLYSSKQQYNGSRVSSSSVCTSSHGVCVCGWCTQEIELQHEHVQCNNRTHIVGPHTRYTKHTQHQKQSAYSSLALLCSPFSTFDAHGVSSQPLSAREPCVSGTRY